MRETNRENENFSDEASKGAATPAFSVFVYVTGITAKMCFRISNSTQDLFDGKQKLFHQIKNDNIYTMFLKKDFF